VAEQFLGPRGRSLAWARLFYLHGPAEDPRRLVPMVIQKLRAGDEVALGAGTQIRDYLHVDDAARGLWAVGQSGLQGAVNVASGQPVTIAQVVREIAAQVGRPELLKLGARPPVPNDPPFICADIRRLREGTGWTPRHGLRDGLAATLAWWSRPPTQS
jgi:nucleoside-diphosphate-sugar epimerase